jgi:glycosyltransferase involved in cell wall biosynthesis
LDKKNKKLYVAGRLPNPLNSIKGNLNYILTRMPFYLDKSMFNYEKFVDPADVQYYLNASDILFISKIKALNSGNVSLGFTFGKVVVGPDVGVIGEILKETGNPVYNPHKLNTIVKAIEKGFNLAAQGHGENNSEYAEKNMQWNMIANKHINFYKDLLKMKTNSN